MSGGKGGKGGKNRVRGGAGKRRQAREMAVQMLYQRELGGSDLEAIFASYDRRDYLNEPQSEDGDGAAPAAPASTSPADESRLAEAFAYARRLVEGTVTHRAELDELIRRHAENWRLERMPTIDRNILRMALYEMLHHQGVPKVVIVDEAIELAKKFGSENSGRFVNGLLDGVLKSRAAAERRANAEAERGPA